MNVRFWPITDIVAPHNNSPAHTAETGQNFPTPKLLALPRLWVCGGNPRGAYGSVVDTPGRCPSPHSRPRWEVGGCGGSTDTWPHRATGLCSQPPMTGRINTFQFAHAYARGQGMKHHTEMVQKPEFAARESS